MLPQKLDGRDAQAGTQVRMAMGVHVGHAVQRSSGQQKRGAAVEVAAAPHVTACCRQILRALAAQRVLHAAAHHLPLGLFAAGLLAALAQFRLLAFGLAARDDGGHGAAPRAE